MSFRRKVKRAQDFIRDKISKDDGSPNHDKGSPNPSGSDLHSVSLTSTPQQVGEHNANVTPARAPTIPPPHDASASKKYPNLHPHSERPLQDTGRIANERLGIINASPGAMEPRPQAATATDDTETETTEILEPQRDECTNLSSDPEQAEDKGSPDWRDLRPAQVAGVVPDRRSATRKSLKGFVRALGPVTNLFGPVKEVAEVLLECLDKCEMAGEAKSEYDVLRVRLEGLFRDLQGQLKEGCSLTMTSSMEALCKSIQAELNFVKQKLDGTTEGRYIGAPGEEDEILSCYRRIEANVQRLSLNANLSMWKVIHEHTTESRSNRMSSRVERLPRSPSAWFDSAEGVDLKRRGCTPGTRVGVLATALDWARSDSKGGVYWLNGMAGTGKTTIAYSVCAELDAGHQLGASFFCSRLREECRNVNLIIPSIAYQLARFSLPFQSALSSVLERDSDLHERRPEMQFDGLIAKPLLQVEKTLPEGLVVVIDALDECENKDSTRQMLDILLSRAATLPIKVMVLSRPEPEIRDQMTADRTKARLVLHELEKGEVQADIETYLRAELAPMSPEEADIKTLVERAGILFIYAATAVRYVGYDSFRRNPRSRLHTILDVSHTPGTTKHEEIDQLYTTVLKASLGDPRLEPLERDDMRQVLHTVICAREPLTVGAISEFLEINDIERVRASLRPLWSVLHVVEANEVATTLHASFPDFMFDSIRSQAFHCDSKAHNLKLAELCFGYINRTQPQFNICRLKSSYLFDNHVTCIEERVVESISPMLFYSCRYWANHIVTGNRASSTREWLRDFLSMRLLLWMEVLNLKKQMKAGTECMKLAVKWCKDINGEQELIELTEDAKRFVETFASNPVSESTPHLYISMLAFWPRNSPIATHYTRHNRGPVEPEGTALDRRQLAHLSTWMFEGSKGVMTVSPDGLNVAVGVGTEVVVVDSFSGRKLLEPLRGHLKTVRSIAFSAAGSRIVAGSFDFSSTNATILGWNTRSGDIVLGPLHLEAHTSYINCLSFSPDLTRIATGSHDNTAYLWDGDTGNIQHRLPAQDEVFVTAFSPDGTQLAIGSRSMLQIWDTDTGNTSLAPLTHSHGFRVVAFCPNKLHILNISYNDNAISVYGAQSGEEIPWPTEGHKTGVICMGYSPDGNYIVVGSVDDTMRVLDSQNGNVVLGPLKAHTGAIISVVFTPDGSRIISACEDGVVCTWDAQQRNFAPHSTNAPFDPIIRVKFSSDGTRFISGSKAGTISIWDAQTGEMRVGLLEAHTSTFNAVDFWGDRVLSGADDGTVCICDARTGEVVLGPLGLNAVLIWKMVFSPDGQMFATVSSDGIDVWNAQNGNRIIGPLTGLVDRAACARFSPDGTRIVGSSLSDHANIVLWDAPTGKNIFGTLGGHRNYIQSLSYSPNGALIASGSNDTTIIVWDACTGKKRLGPLTGHSAMVLSVHFSPDSTRLVSGAYDRTIRIWDVQTGEMVFNLLNGHKSWITSVEYSPDGTRILSRSFDKSVRIHDARSPAERAASLSDSEVGDWTIDKDGWVIDDQSRLLVWVPGDIRKALLLPSTLQVKVSSDAYLRLRFDKSRMGESWAEGYQRGM